MPRGGIKREVMIERAREKRAEDEKRWTYKKLGEYLGMSEMGAYYALNPEKRISISERGDGLSQHTILLTDEEWTQVEERALAAHCSRTALMRKILLGEAPAL